MTYQIETGTLCANGYPDKLTIQDAVSDMFVTSCLWDGSQVAPTLSACNAGGAQRMPDKQNFNAVLTEGKQDNKYTVRRLTPLECSRLQGFPDWWMDDVPTTDSHKYKLWGNGICLPCAVDVLWRINNAVQKESDLG